MRPARRPIAVYRGDTYQHYIRFIDGNGDPIDLTGVTFTAQLRTSPESPDVLADMTTTQNDDTGELWLTIDAADTADLIAGRRAWDLQRDAAGIITTVLYGTADVLGDVTREVTP